MIWRLGVVARFALVLLVALVVGSCGGDDDSSEGAAAQPADEAPETLKVAYPANSTVDMLTYIAKAQGYFEREGLEVEITNGVGSNNYAMVASGQQDISQGSNTGVMLTSAGGKGMSIIYGAGGGVTGGTLVGSPENSGTIEELQALDSCKIATWPEGTSSYAFAERYIDQLGLKCELITLDNAPGMIASLETGRVQGVVSILTSFLGAIAENKAVPLIDTSNPEHREKYLGEVVTDFAEFGAKENLESKRSAVVKYLKGRQEALKFVEDSSPEEIAEVLKQFPEFGEVPDLVRNVEIGRSYLGVGTEDGYISEDAWNAALEEYGTWGVADFDASNPAFAYDKVVDMSYYEEALGKPGAR